MEGLELVSFQIISAVGSAKSNYIEAIKLAKEGKFEEADSKIKEGDELFVGGHSAHAKIIQEEASGDSVPFSILLMHAEDQMSSCETIKILAVELIDLYKSKMM